MASSCLFPPTTVCVSRQHPPPARTPPPRPKLTSGSHRAAPSSPPASHFSKGPRPWRPRVPSRLPPCLCLASVHRQRGHPDALRNPRCRSAAPRLSGHNEVLLRRHAAQQPAQVGSGGGRTSVAPASPTASARVGGAVPIEVETAPRSARQRGGGCEKDRGYIDFAPSAYRVLEAILHEVDSNEDAAQEPGSQCDATAFGARRRGEVVLGKRTRRRAGLWVVEAMRGARGARGSL